jgi:hypothetical protein
MKPQIDRAKFGSITIDGTKDNYDIIIRLDGKIKKRKKALSKTIYGTSHKISLDEARHIYEKTARYLILGTGHYDQVRLSAEAAEFFEQHGCRVEVLTTPQAIRAWNEAEGDANRQLSQSRIPPDIATYVKTIHTTRQHQIEYEQIRPAVKRHVHLPQMRWRSQCPVHPGPITEGLVGPDLFSIERFPNPRWPEQ